uniref:DNA mismatch repair proteins mutS family domain-containing protein n=1 Tax=viral metagenome TaxID=1070528 RepID=A0A6C0IBW7_9ZZZZ
MLASLLVKFGLTKENPVNNQDISSNEQIKKPIYDSFRLPITYVESSKIHPMSPVLVSDLELVQLTNPNPNSKPIYDVLFQPSHSWGKQMIPEWSKQFSTDKQYLTDTQQVISEMGSYQDQVTVLDDQHCTQFQDMWDSIHAPCFLEKYNYMEWDCLKHLNESTVFLQLLSVGNIMSPIISLLIPILFLIFPFLILKLQGTPITFEVYIQVLQEIAKNHFIGKAIVGLKSMSIDKLMYVILMFGLYLMQIYQNVLVCIRFHENTKKLNHHLLELKKHVEYSIHSMETFHGLHSTKISYTEFCKDVQLQVERLHQLHKWLTSIQVFSVSLQKGGELGYMLRVYYELYRNQEYQEALRYSVGFEGMIDNLRGVYRHIVDGNMAIACLDANLYDRRSVRDPKKGVSTLEHLRCSEGGFGKDVGSDVGSETSEWQGGDKGLSGKGAESLCTTNSEGDRMSPEEFDKEDVNKMLFQDQYYPSLLSSEKIVKNNINMKKNMILSGSNASGKTTFLKTTALNLIFTQQIGGGFYSRGNLPKPYTHIHSYLNIPDTSERDSLFQAEARRCKDILDIISTEPDTSHHFCIFDELYSGTNPKEACKAAYAFLKYLSANDRVDFILTTHYVAVCRRFRKSKRVKNYQMKVILDECGKIKYTYQIHTGISMVEGAVRILEDLNYPKEIMDMLC